MRKPIKVLAKSEDRKWIVEMEESTIRAITGTGPKSGKTVQVRDNLLKADLMSSQLNELRHAIGSLLPRSD